MSNSIENLVVFGGLLGSHWKTTPEEVTHSGTKISICQIYLNCSQWFFSRDALQLGRELQTPYTYWNGIIRKVILSLSYPWPFNSHLVYASLNIPRRHTHWRNKIWVKAFLSFIPNEFCGRPWCWFTSVQEKPHNRLEKR